MTRKRMTDIPARMRELTALFVRGEITDEQIAEFESLTKCYKQIEEERSRNFRNAMDLQAECVRLGDEVKRLELELAAAREQIASIDRQLAKSPSSRPPPTDMDDK